MSEKRPDQLCDQQPRRRKPCNSGYDETPVVAHMKGREVAITVDIGLGQGRARVWTCDLTHGYIDITLGC